MATYVTGNKQGVSWGRVLMWALLIFYLFITLFPFWWVLRTALTTSNMVYTDAQSLLPVGFTWDNFLRVLGFLSVDEAVAAGGSGQSINFFLFLRNSFIFASVIAIAQTFFSALAAYAFARLKFGISVTIGGTISAAI